MATDTRPAGSIPWFTTELLKAIWVRSVARAGQEGQITKLSEYPRSPSPRHLGLYSTTSNGFLDYQVKQCFSIERSSVARSYGGLFVARYLRRLEGHIGSHRRPLKTALALCLSLVDRPCFASLGPLQHLMCPCSFF